MWPGQGGELPCLSRGLLHCCVLSSVCILRMLLGLGQAPNLPELSLEQLPHDTALHMGLCKAQYLEVLLAPPAAMQESPSEVSQLLLYTMILLILTPWLSHPQSELGLSSTHRRKSWIQLSYHMTDCKIKQERSPQIIVNGAPICNKRLSFVMIGKTISPWWTHL